MAETGQGPTARVHVFETGRLVANKTFLRGEGFASLLRPVELVSFPALCFVIEHPEGLIAVDTGLAADPPRGRSFRGFPPRPTPSQDLALRMREAGLDAGDIRWVVLTHLDWDHTGGLQHVGGAEVLLHRPEHAFAQTRMGRFRYRPSSWPEGFSPSVYDLDPEPFGPFPASRAVTAAGDVRIVPIPGHSPGQVAVTYETGDVTLLFAADHMLREDWFCEDVAAGRPLMLGVYGKAAARETTRRLAAFVRERPTVLLPAHDTEAADRLQRRTPTRLGPVTAAG